MTQDLPTQRLTELFTGPLDAAWFAPSFLAAIPAAQVTEILRGLTASFGKLTHVDLADGQGTIHLERATMPVRIGLDAQARIDMLWFGTAVSSMATLEDIAANLSTAAMGTLSILVAVDGQPLLERDADVPMAVGSAFKLVVLKAYEAAIARGALSRDTVATFEEQDRSLPSGTLQVLPAGTPVTLESLAALMIQISDNTATDTLMRVLGREAMEALSPRNAPFLTTRELFRLAASADDLRQRFAAGTREERAALLAGLADGPLPNAMTIGRKATWPEAEWFLSAREICDLLAELQDAPALSVPEHPLFAAHDWPRFGFKGGSEFGVLNLSAIGTAPDGRTVCVVVTANGEAAQSEIAIAPLFSALFPAALR
jgi:hypothetical protein